jgi:hypothetical protein
MKWVLLFAALAVGDTRPATVHALLQLRSYTRADAEQAVAPAQTQNDARYEKLRGLTRISGKAPLHFFFAGDKVALVYASADFLTNLSAATIKRELGREGTRLASRAGKTSVQHVYPEMGFAYSETGGVCDFAEVFPPTTLADYQKRIYQAPGPFIK